MKRIITLVVAFAICLVCGAQNKGKKEKTQVTFYGVDFSAVNVVGAKESAESFIKAFDGINGLLISEPAKYNVGKYMKLEVTSTVIDTAKEQVKTLSGKDFKNQAPQEIPVQEIIKKYPQVSGNCLLIIAKELNKTKNKGTFIAVIYDGTTKQILSERTFSGKSKGAGLRNFWAGSLYEALKKFK